MRMINAYTNTIFNNYFRFDGRMARAEFWWFTLCNFLIIFAFVILAGIFGAFAAGEHSLFSSFVILIYALYMLAILLPSLGAQARRLHDVDLSAWLLLLNLIPYIGAIALTIIYIFPAKTGGAKYGPYHDSLAY
ncbi:DUF805 domain-containing protein [Acidithiobacillus sp. IBUN Pt1247-S3]|uniref:DUF805 domain-containing protein n=1 Tax=Acidithiobacillus sp. IBUN Pt1247-S3 TaxID=3166642 RepID=UPI0034E595E8